MFCRIVLRRPVVRSLSQRKTRVSGSMVALVAFIATIGSLHRVHADQVKLDVSLAYPVMKIESEGAANQKSTNHLRIALKGFELPSSKERSPVNVAIVIDRSGSMSGPKIEQAKQAAIQAISMLQDSDIVSVVTYADGVEVLIPATKASDRAFAQGKISSIHADGSTALFAGVAQGAVEVRKFMSKQYVNRVVLLSDGQANVGPSTPGELEEFGRSLLKEGISVSTFGLGLGYNEDLMSKLAMASSGNHAFVESPNQLASIFHNEFRDVQSVIAQGISIEAVFAAGVRPVKVLGYSADISGQTVSFNAGQLYSKQERYFVVEVEVPMGSEAGSRSVVAVSAEYRNMVTETQDKLASAVEVRYSKDPVAVEKAIDKSVLASCALQVANERNRMATELRDQGDIEGAKKTLLQNADYLRFNYSVTGDLQLQMRCVDNETQAKEVENADWNASRKLMRALQTQDAIQQRYK